MKHAHLRCTNDRDDLSLNLFWAYGSKLITKKQYLKNIDKIKYDTTREYKKRIKRHQKHQ